MRIDPTKQIKNDEKIKNDGSSGADKVFFFIISILNFNNKINNQTKKKQTKNGRSLTAKTKVKGLNWYRPYKIVQTEEKDLKRYSWLWSEANRTHDTGKWQYVAGCGAPSR